MEIENQGETKEDLSSSDDELDFDGKFSFIYTLILALKHRMGGTLRRKCEVIVYLILLQESLGSAIVTYS